MARLLFIAGLVADVRPGEVDARSGSSGIPVVVAGLLLTVGARWMPQRTAKGTAIARRVGGFRTVIETAETHMSRWAEEQNVFTRYLPYAIVFGCTEKWAKAFEGLRPMPPDTTWYRSSRPFIYADFGRTLDDFSVTTGRHDRLHAGRLGLERVLRRRVLRRRRRRRRRRIVVATRSMGRRAHRLL